METEIYSAARAEWLGVLSQMWDAVGKPTDTARLIIYERQLRDVPLGLLEKAVARSIRNNGNYQNVPTISAIWAAIKKEVGDPYDVDTALEIWSDSEWDKIIIRVSCVPVETI